MVGRLVFVLCSILSRIFFEKNSEKMIENDLPLEVVMAGFDGVLGGCKSSWIVDQRCFEFSEDFTLSAKYLLRDSVMSIFVARQCFRYSS